MIYELKFLEIMQNIFSIFHSYFYILIMKHFWKIKTISILNHWKWTKISFIIWTKLRIFVSIANSMIQLHVREIFWNTKSNDSTNNIEILISRLYENHISMSTIFHTSSSIFITNIHKKMNLIIHSKFRTIKFRQNNKFDISNRYFSQVHERNMNQFFQIWNFYHRFHFVNFIARLDISNRISSQHRCLTLWYYKKKTKFDYDYNRYDHDRSLCTLILCNLVKSMKKRKRA